MEYTTENITERVRQMEAHMDAVQQAVKNSTMHTPEILERCRILADYMDSGLWLQDYEADERGELPAGLKRGVLSEDALYDLLTMLENEI
ncbi:MAG: DUF4298 domain-containing protein [Clostridia bacterium]|nr:DUF4298 domain-containing protein [Clostridia bacterium]